MPWLNTQFLAHLIHISSAVEAKKKTQKTERTEFFSRELFQKMRSLYWMRFVRMKVKMLAITIDATNSS